MGALMAFRDDHEAALQRIAALEEQLARTERERDRLKAEAEAHRRGPQTDSPRVRDLEQQLAAALAEGSKASEALARLEPRGLVSSRDHLFRIGLLGVFGVAIAAVVASSLQAGVFCIAATVMLIAWHRKRE